jgi:hypothetical protein
VNFSGFDYERFAIEEEGTLANGEVASVNQHWNNES